MKALLSTIEQQGNYSFEIQASRGSPIKLFAPHGGCIEPGTAPIVKALAGDQYDYFIFRGLRKGKNCKKLLHVTSSHYNEERCKSMAQNALVAFSVHGCRGKDIRIEVGGGNRKLAVDLVNLLMLNYPTALAPARRNGSSPLNFVNKAKHKGIQLELSHGLRDYLFFGYPKSPKPNPETFSKFIETVRTWLRRVEKGLAS
jgi:phage replication-related protein YjqB (UPF0714/DUF867 family)